MLWDTCRRASGASRVSGICHISLSESEIIYRCHILVNARRTEERTEWLRKRRDESACALSDGGLTEEVLN